MVARAAEESPAELTTARQIHALSSADVLRSLPSHLHGVVTVVTTLSSSSFFLLDASGGVYIRSSQSSPHIEPGMEVDVHGVAAPGLFAPILNATSVLVTGRKTLPTPRVYQWDELSGGKQDSNWIAVRGLVHSASIQHPQGFPVLVMQVDIGSGNVVTAYIYDYPGDGWEQLRGASVRIVGVSGTAFNDRKQFVSLRLYVARFEDIHLEQVASADPFSLPLRPIDSLLHFGDAFGAIEQVKVRGVVISTRFEEGMYIQDGKSGVYLQTGPGAPVRLGSVVEAAGFPESGSYSPIVANAVYRVVGQTLPIEPQPVIAAKMVGATTDGMSTAPFDASLVRLQGNLVEVIAGLQQDQLILEDDQRIFTARLPHAGTAIKMPAVGALLRVTGVCVAQVDRNHNARDFELLLRSPADIVVVKDVSWWNLRRAGWLVATVMVTAFLALGGWLFSRHHNEMRDWAMTDPLTGLSNRRAFFLLGEQKWQSALRKRESLLLFFLDIDRFKEINDSFGHREGDRALQATADLLRLCFRTSDVIARMGGDEFAIACDANAESLTVMETRLEAAVREWNEQPGQLLELSLSFGSVVCDASVAAYSLSELITRADHRMYEQKQLRKQTRSGQRPMAGS